MLKVTVKNEEVVDDRWERGMVRMSEDGDIVIFLASDRRSDGEIYPVVLRYSFTEKGYISNADKDVWIKFCPIVVENAELIIGGGSND